MRALTFTQDIDRATRTSTETGQHHRPRDASRRRWPSRCGWPKRASRSSATRRTSARPDRSMAAVRGSSSAGRRARCSYSTVMADLRRYFMPRPAGHAGRAACTSAATARTPNTRSSSICSSAIRNWCTATGRVVRRDRMSRQRRRSRVRRVRQARRQPAARRQHRSCGRRSSACSRAISSTAACRSKSPRSSTPASPGRARRSPLFAGGKRDVIRSVGGAVRINAFGLLIVELAASHPLDRAGKGSSGRSGSGKGFNDFMIGNRSRNRKHMGNAPWNRIGSRDAQWNSRAMRLPSPCLIDAIADCH